MVTLTGLLGAGLDPESRSAAELTVVPMLMKPDCRVSLIWYPELGNSGPNLEQPVLSEPVVAVKCVLNGPSTVMSQPFVRTPCTPVVSPRVFVMILQTVMKPVGAITWGSGIVLAPMPGACSVPWFLEPGEYPAPSLCTFVQLHLLTVFLTAPRDVMLQNSGWLPPPS